VPLDYKQTPDTVNALLNLPEQWEVEKVELRTNDHQDVLWIAVRESDSFLKGLTWEKCDGPLEIIGHEKPQTWSYPDTMGHHTQIECSLPQLRCKKSGAVVDKFPVKLPWAEKGKLISPRTPPEKP
jgi:hypothetical protein